MQETKMQALHCQVNTWTPLFGSPSMVSSGHLFLSHGWFISKEHSAVVQMLFNDTRAPVVRLVVEVFAAQVEFIHHTL